MKDNNLEEISKLLRSRILKSTTGAGSGHPTSSLSAVELMVALMFGGGFRYKINDPRYHNNDRLIFSKGHASPLLYALWSVAGVVSEEELMTLREFESNLEGHPTMNFSHAEVATGSLGQGLSVGVGMALSAKMDKLPFRTHVLLGDSEMAEGQNWEAMQVAAYYKLDNLVGIIDVNRLGQRGETMYGHKTGEYEKKCRAFGWHVEVVEGHSVEEIILAYQQASFIKGSPTMIVAKTIKGKGVSLIEDKEEWHGKVLNKEELTEALNEVGEVDDGLVGKIEEPEDVGVVGEKTTKKIKKSMGDKNTLMSTRKAYGEALLSAYIDHPEMVVLDAEVSNSTYAKTFSDKYPDKFIEMYIAEQNMVGVALGMSLLGKIPFLSTFSAFLTRAHDQIRTASYNNVHLNVVGSHAGVSIGEDGSSQMGLEDISMFRSVMGSVVLYPADKVATNKLVEKMVLRKGVNYLRTTRMDVESLYDEDEDFCVGGSKTLKTSDSDKVTVIGAGITLHESLRAYEALREDGINVRVIDLYSIKPIDTETLVGACKDTKALVVVEDHYEEGGMTEAVRSALVYETTPIHSLAVLKMPRSGKPRELLAFEEIDCGAIVKKVREIINNG